VKPTSSMVELAHEAMATTFHLRLASKTEKFARQAAAAAWSELARLESLLSRYVDGSDVGRINQASPRVPVRINADTMHCLTEAMRMASLTDSAFDPMLGALTDGPNHARPNPNPRAAETNVPVLVLNETKLTAARTHENVSLDLGGIGKGFAVDRLAVVLRDWEIPAACIDAGGSTIFAFGQPSTGFGWQARMATQVIPLKDASLAGSGTSVKGNHIIDGRTGSRCAQYTRVWAYAPTAAEADALSTAFFAFSVEEMGVFCTRHPHYGAAWLTPGKAVRAFGALQTRLTT